MTEVAEVSQPKIEKAKEAPILVTPERMDRRKMYEYKKGLNDRATERTNAIIAARQAEINRIAKDPDAAEGDIKVAGNELADLDGEARGVIAEANIAADAVLGEQSLPSGSYIGDPEKGTALNVIDSPQGDINEATMGEQSLPSDFVIGDPSKGTALNVVDSDGKLALQFEQSRKDADAKKAEEFELPKMYQPGTPEYMYSQFKSEQNKSRQKSQDEIHSGKPPSMDHAAVRESLRAQQQLLSQALLAKRKPSPEVAMAYQRELENIIATEKTRQWAYAHKETDPAKIAAHQEWQEKVFRGADFQKIADNARAEADKLRLEWEANGPSEDLDARFGVEEDAIREYQLYAYLKKTFSGEDGVADTTPESLEPDNEVVEGEDLPAADDEKESIVTGEPAGQPRADAELTAEVDDGTEQDEESVEDGDDEITAAPAEAPAFVGTSTAKPLAETSPVTSPPKPLTETQTRVADVAPSEAAATPKTAEGTQDREGEVNLEHRLFELWQEVKDGKVSSERGEEIVKEVTESLEGNKDYYRLMDGAHIAIMTKNFDLAKRFLDTAEENNHPAGQITPRLSAERSCTISGMFAEAGDFDSAQASLDKAVDTFPNLEGNQLYDRAVKALSKRRKPLSRIFGRK